VAPHHQAEWDAIREELEGAGGPQASARKISATFDAPA